MSATGRGAVRADNDWYPSPAWTVHRLLERVDLPGGHWLELAAGEGAIIRAVNAVRSDVTWSAIELRPTCRPVLARLTSSLVIADATDCPWHFRPGAISVAITNPPFTLAQRMIELALASASVVAMLLRLNYLSSAKRAGFFQDNPPDVYVLPDRPIFRGNHADNADYGWFVWPPDRDRTEGKLAILGTTPKSVRLAERPRLVSPPTLQLLPAATTEE